MSMKRMYISYGNEMHGHTHNCLCVRLYEIMVLTKQLKWFFWNEFEHNGFEITFYVHIDLFFFISRVFDHKIQMYSDLLDMYEFSNTPKIMYLW